MSKQREAIYSELKSTKAHPTAEELLAMVQKCMPSVNLATIYRNIEYFKKYDLIKILPTEQSLVRYDADTSDHAHLTCTSCRRVTDIELSIEMTKTLKSQHDGKFELMYTGLCDNCKNNKQIKND